LAKGIHILNDLQTKPAALPLALATAAAVKHTAVGFCRDGFSLNLNHHKYPLLKLSLRTQLRGVGLGFIWWLLAVNKINPKSIFHT
jgi:hypothetical protein